MMVKAVLLYICINLYLNDIFQHNSNDDDTNLEAGHDGEGAEAERHHIGDRGHSDRDASVSHGLADLERIMKLPSSDRHKKVCKTILTNKSIKIIAMYALGKFSVSLGFTAPGSGET